MRGVFLRRGQLFVHCYLVTLKWPTSYEHGSRSERDTHCHTTRVSGVQCRWERQPNVQTHTFAFQQEPKFSKRNSSTIQPLWQKEGRTIERVDFDRAQTMNPAGFILRSSFTSRWLFTTNKNIFTKSIKGINTLLFMSILLLRCLYKIFGCLVAQAV
jgi:hypothetical protein